MIDDFHKTIARFRRFGLKLGWAIFARGVRVACVEMPPKSQRCRKRPAANHGAQPEPKRVLPQRVGWKKEMEQAPPHPDWESELARLFSAELS